ncbi:MAG: FtsH protease activity modulator HflK [Syntrophobacteraceae bacterium]
MVWETPPGRRAPERGGPPQDIEEVLRWLRQRFRSSPPTSLRLIVMIVALVVVILVGLNSYYTVEPQETAVVQRFGQYIGTADAGLHFKIPFGIDSVSKVVTGRVLQREYGYRTVQPDVRSQFVEKGYEEESLMLSGDLNVVNLQWTVQYKIKDPVEYLFKVSGVEATLDDISESVTRRIVGNRYSDEVLTVGRASIADQCKVEIQEIMDLYRTGLQIVAVKLQNANPPNPVKPAFNEVNEARQEKERMINEAQQAYNQKIPRAGGEARQTVTQAEGYALERVNRSEGEAKRFLDILAEYQKAPEVTRRRMYLDSFEALMGRVDHLFVVDESQKNILPLFDLNKLSEQGGKTQSPQAQPKGQ